MISEKLRERVLSILETPTSAVGICRRLWGGWDPDDRPDLVRAVLLQLEREGRVVALKDAAKVRTGLWVLA